MKRTVVWHMFGTMDIGGAELRTLELADAIRQHGVDFEYVTLSGRNGALDGRIVAAGSTVRPIPLGMTWPFRFVSELRLHKPDVVDSHVATFSGSILLLAWIARVPVRIAHFRSDGDGRPDRIRRRIQRAVMKFLILRCATDIVGVSPSALSLGFGSLWQRDQRARIIPNGLPRHIDEAPAEDLRATLGLSSASILVMHVGRPSPEKNRPLAVRAVSALRASGVEAHLALVGGTGADAQALAEVHGDVGREWVHELGVRSDVRGLMQQADVVILTSLREGLPGVVLEALSVGAPVVSSALPGVRFIAEHVCGVTIVESDSLNDWAAALNVAAVCVDGDARQLIAATFRKGAFSLERSVEAHMHVYMSRATT